MTLSVSLPNPTPSPSPPALPSKSTSFASFPPYLLMSCSLLLWGTRPRTCPHSTRPKDETPPSRLNARTAAPQSDHGFVRHWFIYLFIPHTVLYFRPLYGPSFNSSTASFSQSYLRPMLLLLAPQRERRRRTRI